VLKTCQKAELATTLPLLFYRCALGLSEVEIFRSAFDSSTKEALYAALPSLHNSIRDFMMLFYNEEVTSFVRHALAADSARCRKWLAVKCVAAVKEKFDLDHTFEPLAWHWDFLSTSDGSACELCRRELEEAARAERTSLWESLPDIFGLGSWSSLIEADSRYQASLESRE
jgi:hypothetical protein